MQHDGPPGDGRPTGLEDPGDGADAADGVDGAFRVEDDEVGRMADGDRVFGAVDASGDGVDLVEQRELVAIDRCESAAMRLADFGDRIGQLDCACAAFGPMPAEDRARAVLGRGLLDRGDLGIAVGVEMVDRDDRGDAELADVLDVADEVGLQLRTHTPSEHVGALGQAARSQVGQQTTQDGVAWRIAQLEVLQQAGLLVVAHD